MIDEKVITFLKEHHLLTLSTCEQNISYSASCFYSFLQEPLRFVVASDPKTKHLSQALKNPNVSGCIALETKEIGKIQGIQFQAILEKSSIKESANYLAKHPYAVALNPKLWTLHVKYLKFTDNRLGFGKKLEYKEF